MIAAASTVVLASRCRGSARVHRAGEAMRASEPAPLPLTETTAMRRVSVGTMLPATLRVEPANVFQVSWGHCKFAFILSQLFHKI